MQRFLKLLITQPDLLVEHVAAYAELASADLKMASQARMHRVLWSAAFFCCVTAAAVLAGVALMLWIATPEGVIRTPWVLVATPLAPLIAVIVCMRKLKSAESIPAFAKVREQLAADLQMLQEAGLR
jgi:uncharacterized membrane protein YqjE